MFQTTSIFIFHQLPSNPLSDLKCPLEVVLEKVQWMAVWHCPLTPCSQAMPDTHSDVFSQALMSEVRAILERVVITCLSNVIFIGSSCLPTHSYGHTSVITVPCENHPGSTECTGELSNTKRPRRPQKTTVVDDRRILSLVKKNPFTTVGQIKNTLQEVGVCVSKSTIKRRLHRIQRVHHKM